MPQKKSAIKKELAPDPKTGARRVIIRKKKKPEAKAPAKAPAKSSKAAFVRREIAKGNLKKEGGKIVEAKAKPAPKPKAPAPKAKASAPKEKGLTPTQLTKEILSYKQTIDFYESVFNELSVDMMSKPDFNDKGSMTQKFNRADKKANLFIDRKIREALKKDKITSVAEFEKKYDTLKKFRKLLGMDEGTLEQPKPKAPKPKPPPEKPKPAKFPSDKEAFALKDKLIELAMEEEELIETDGATDAYLKALNKMEETTPIYKHQQPRLMLAKAINPNAKSTSKTLLKLYQEARKKGVLKGEVLQKWNEWKQAIAEGAKLMRIDEIGLVPV